MRGLGLGLSALAGMVAAGAVVAMLYPPFFPFSLALAFLAVPAAELALTPLWRWGGFYRYFSPLLFTVRRGSGFELHAGTLYDYLLHAIAFGATAAARHELRRRYLYGLLQLIRCIEEGGIPSEARLTMVTYLFSERGSARLGFRLDRAGWRERVHLGLDVVGGTFAYSYARGRFEVPPVWRARRGVTTAGELAAQKPRIERLLYGRFRPGQPRPLTP